MNTTTASRPAAETAIRRASRQPQQSTTPRKLRAASPARQSTGKAPTNPLQGLFSDDELAMIDQRCKAMGRNVVEIVVSALRNWVKADGQEDDSHLENGTPPKTDDQEAQRAAALARFAEPFGKQIARITNRHGEWEMIFQAGAYFYYLFEYQDVFEKGEWMVLDEYLIANNGDMGSLAGKTMKRGLSWCAYDLEEIASWFDEHHIEYPAAFRHRIEYERELKREREQEIARKAVAQERARIARVMNQALAA